jgi:FAD/FMN-containing dehydrogenase
MTNANMRLLYRFSGTKAGVSITRQWSEDRSLTTSQVQENVQLVKALAKQHKSGDFEFAVDAAEQKMLWSARKESLWSMLALREEGHEVWSTDVAVPLSRLPDIIGMLAFIGYNSHQVRL